MSPARIGSRIRRARPLLLLLAIAACDASGSTETGPVVTAYTLTTIDGAALPHQVDQSADGTIKYVVTDMVLSVSNVGSWYSSGHRTVTTNGVPSIQPLSAGGTYLISAPAATFIDSTGVTVWTGTFSGSSFSLTNSLQQQYVFTR